nr:hypothetical protein [Tanacetum cinerariifolium]
MALTLMAKAFKLNYSTPTNNNQRISSNPRNRQIAQQGMNMGQDRQIQMVGVAQNLRVQNVRNQNGLIGVSRNANLNGNGNLVTARAEGNAAGHNGILLQAEEFDLMAAAADLDEILEVNANCILMANLQQASTSGTQTDKASVYDSDGSAEVHDYENCDDNEIFNMFIQEEQYTELLEPIPEPHQALELEIERLLRAVVIQDIMSVVQKTFVVDTSNLQFELERTKERFENCIIKKENEYAKLWNDTFRVILFSIHNDEWKSFQSQHQKALRGRLLASFQDLEHEGGDTRSQGGIILKDKDLEISVVRDQDPRSETCKWIFKRIPKNTRLQVSRRLKKDSQLNDHPLGGDLMEIVIPEVGGIDDDILLTIKDGILREKLLNINLFIANIEALNDNATPSSDFMTKSSSTSLNSLLEETNTFANSLPELETFCFDLEEISSGSTTTRSDISLPEYEAFYDDHGKEISSGSTTTHSDCSLYDSFIFDLSINPFPPSDRSDFYEFADELTLIISSPEYDCFCFNNEPNSGDFTMDVVENIFPTKEPRVHNALPTHRPFQLNMDFILSSESLAYVVWIFFHFLSYLVAPKFLLSFGNEDTIFDPGICSYHISSFMSDVSR